MSSPATIFRATLSDQTDRYGHDVLGGNEYARINIWYLPGGGDRIYIHEIVLPPGRVFEDIEARVADLNGDGFNEVVVVESSDQGGAQLAIYGVPGNRPSKIEAEDIVKLTATPPIGRPFRWLAPAGIADFDRDGQNDVAYVETPHIGGVLRIWTMRDGDLVEIASDPGYSNHKIGQNFITGGVRDCGNGPELVLPDNGWSKTLLAWQYGGVIESAVLFADARPETIATALDCS